ncbi:MAG TPA: hypothetical protein PLB31_05280 [Fimbriimonadaceae bacterium]|nr:hypothetical protein [Armatimonadota bacterium]HCM73602.1 hypothetical protein [Armatimonadota bacterium]HRE92609.1 hypothetical protein [Fimbriimonadaceae bacterium]HRI73867.1 hypothetical protein [Fimbriimonadaceae bacterium]
MSVATHHRIGQGFGIGQPDPKRTSLATPAQVQRLRRELSILQGSEAILLALVYANGGREGINHLEAMNHYEVQLAFQILNYQRNHRVLRCTAAQPGGEQA